MGIRESFSRLMEKAKKKVKHLRGKYNTDKTGIDSSGDGVDTTCSLSPHVATSGGHTREDNKSDTGERAEIHSADQLPAPGLPEPAPASGSVNGGGASQHRLGPRPDLQGVVGSKLDQKGSEVDREKVGRVFPSSSAPSFTHSMKPGGM